MCKYSEELIRAIERADKKCPEKTFYAFNGYFTLHKDRIYFLSDEYGDGPRGGKAIPTFSGLGKEKDRYLEGLLSKYEMSASDLAEKLYEAFPYTEPSEIDEEEFEWELFSIDESGDEVLEDDAKKYLRLKKDIEAQKSEFKSIAELIDYVYRYDLDPKELYYPWEGGPIWLYDNTADSLDDPLDVAGEEEWIEVLNDIQSYVANP